jgi:hypothetical protein
LLRTLSSQITNYTTISLEVPILSLKERQKKKYFNHLQSKERYHRENLLFKLANPGPVDLLVDVWVEILKKPSVDKEELVVISISIKKD